MASFQRKRPSSNRMVLALVFWYLLQVFDMLSSRSLNEPDFLPAKNDMPSLPMSMLLSSMFSSSGGKKKRGKFNLLYTSYALRKKTDVCEENCVATRQALIDWNACATRIMSNVPGGSKWESLMITNLKEQGFSYNDSMVITWDGPGPFPHYAKIHVLDQLFNDDKMKFILTLPTGNGDKQHMYENIVDLSNREDEIDWLMWVDADLRITNASFPISKLIDDKSRYDRAYYGKYNGRRISNNEVSLVVAAQLDYDYIINNEFLVKNNIWGKRFVQAWKYYTLESDQEGHHRWKTCGYYDQCPFGIAMLQIVHDYHWWVTQENTPLTEILSHPYNSTLEDFAFRKGPRMMPTVYKEELGKLTGAHENGVNVNLKNTNVPLQIGPVLLVPTWEGGVRFPSDNANIPSSLSLEPTDLFEKVSKDEAPWPFAIHAKYSSFFCSNRTAADFDYEFEWQWNDLLFKYDMKSKKQDHEYDISRCTASEQLSMTNKLAKCYTRWKTSS